MRERCIWVREGREYEGSGGRELRRRVDVWFGGWERGLDAMYGWMGVRMDGEGGSFVRDGLGLVRGGIWIYICVYVVDRYKDGLVLPYTEYIFLNLF